MFFYRAKPVKAVTKEQLLEAECPICGHMTLTKDWWMAFRYSPMAMFRGLFLAFAIALLLSLALYKVDFIWDYLSHFSYLTQERIMIIFLVCVSIPSAFTIIHWEIKLGHLSEDDQHAVGVRCTHCHNGFIGLADAFPKLNSSDENITSENDIPKQENCD